MEGVYGRIYTKIVQEWEWQLGEDRQSKVANKTKYLVGDVHHVTATIVNC